MLKRLWNLWNPHPASRGATYDPPQDEKRVESQYHRVFRLMSDGMPRTLYEIAIHTGDPVQAISARLRDMRKEAFGGHTVAARRIAGGTWSYQLLKVVAVLVVVGSLTGCGAYEEPGFAAYCAQNPGTGDCP
jgi:hypothetical protein